MSIRPWYCCHIDELRLGKFDLDISQLSKESIASALDKKLIPLKNLILDCIPKAASEVKCLTKRVQTRIDILLDPIQESHALLDVFCTILEEKLRTSRTLTDLKAWLVQVSLNSKHLHEGYTFQKSVWLSLSDNITPLLTSLIAICDQDAGLDFLTKE